MPYLTDIYGNASSTHQFGRAARAAIETARKTVAAHLHCSPMELYFTSCGTEADNMIILGAVRDLQVTRIISSAIEHHAVGHSLEACDHDKVKIEMVRLHPNGQVDLDHLRELLGRSDEKTLVSLMHANNEIGSLIDLEEVGNTCREFGALFHSDTVQTIGHYEFDLATLPVDFITGSAHKFHGPKGIGFLYIRRPLQISPLIHGGAQERSKRAGTENIYGIVGLAKALDIACTEMAAHRRHVESLKSYMAEKIREAFPEATFNGCKDRSLYTVLNVSLPLSPNADMLLFLLDIDGIAASAGSACSSGSNQASHVLTALGVDTSRPNLRFSFSKFNTRQEIDYVVERLKVHLGAEVSA